VGTDKEALRRMFPNLAKEIDSGEQKVSIKSVRTSKETGERHVTNGRFVNYVPDVVDFIRRCDTEKQAEEIIAFEEKRGEIDTLYARKLRKQLKERGVRSFGSKKDHDYYLKNGDM
jgi:hypothetical protein